MNTKGSMIALTYMFIFTKESNIWTNLYQFEDDLADFFASNGLEAELIKTVEGSSGGRMMLISKMDEGEKLTNTKGVNIQKQLPEAVAQKSSVMVKQLTKKMTKQFQKGGKR